MDLAQEAILVSLAILGLGSGSRLGYGLLGGDLCAISDMEPAEVAWCRLRRKEFERGLVNKLHQATHSPLHLAPNLPRNTQTHRLDET